MATGVSQVMFKPPEDTFALSWVTLISARDGVSGTVTWEYCPMPALVIAAILAV
jgi:hypothetical protein